MYTVAAPQGAQALVGTCGLQVCIPVSKWDDVSAFVARNGAVTVPGQATAGTGLPTCTNTCSDLWLSEHRPIPGQPTSKALYGELAQLETKTGVWPKLAPALGNVSALAAAGTLGFAIGDAVNRKFLHIGVPGLAHGPLVEDGNPYGQEWRSTDLNDYQWRYVDPGGSGTFGVDGYLWHIPPLVDAMVLYNRSFGDEGVPYGYGQRQSGGSSLDGQCYQRPLDLMGVDMATTANVNLAAGPVPPGCSINGGITNDYPEQVMFYWLDANDMAANQAPDDYDATRDGTPDKSASTWSGQPTSATQLKTRVQTELRDHSEQYPHLTQLIGDTIEEPIGKMDVPDCEGQLLADCLRTLEQAGFTGTHHTVTVEPEDAWVSLPPRTVIETDPRRGAQVDTDGDVIIRRNPAEQDMPVRVPQVLPGTKRKDVERALNDVDLSPHISVRPTASAAYGPDEVTDTPLDPQPGTIVNRGTPVEVEVNPADAPDPPGGGGGTPGGIDFSPIMGLTPCTKFPFGVPCWISDALGGWTVAGEAPVFDLPIPFWDTSWHIDLSVVDPIIGIVRPLLLLSSMLGLALFFMRLTGGFGGGGGGAEDDE